MAEIQVANATGRKRRGVPLLKRLPTRVDLTPMVDLGFLLITFFIFTTTMSEPRAMKLSLPADVVHPGDSTKIDEKNALTILLADRATVYYYSGQLAPDGKNIRQTTMKGLRDIIMEVKSTTNVGDLVAIIKPNEESTYQHIVAALDEMTINDVKRYALVDMTASENAFIQMKQE